MVPPYCWVGLLNLVKNLVKNNSKFRCLVGVRGVVFYVHLVLRVCGQNRTEADAKFTLSSGCSLIYQLL